MGAYITLSALIFIVSVLMILIVLVQNSKGGGLASNFSSNNQYMGVRKTADFLEKSTWTLAIAMLVFSLLTIFVIPRHQTQETENELIEKATQTAAPIQMPDAQEAPIEEMPAE